MGVTFDRWLAKPSTVCLLRRLISSDMGCTVKHGRHWQAHRHQSAVAVAKEDDAIDRVEEQDDVRPGLGTKVLFGGHRTQDAKRLLFMSLRSGAPMIPADLDISSSWDMLKAQADVDSDKMLGKLEVDTPANKHNMILWAEILQMRQRWHGREGVDAVWSGLRKRGVDLPVAGPEAEFLWTTFIYSGIVDRELERSADTTSFATVIFDYAKDLYSRTGQCSPALYKAFVGRFLQVAPHSAGMWHSRLVQAHLAEPNDMVDVATHLMQCKDQVIAQRKFFRRYYKEASRRDMYDVFIAEAFVQELPTLQALKYHKFFLEHGDAPSQAFFSDPRVQELFRLDGDRSLPMITNKPTTPHQPEGTSTSLAQHSTVNREAMNSLVGDVHGIKPKELSDPFCARMFATKAFSTSWVINGLAMFGVNMLGPLAIREMAIRAGAHQNFVEQLSQLKAAGISTGDALFCRLIVKIAKDGSDDLWQTLLESDQHPEAYDDANVQSNLLASFLEHEKWVQAHVGLLAVSLSGERASYWAWNTVLQYHLKNHDHAATVSTLQSIQSQEARLTAYSMDLLRSHVLPLRHVSKRPLKGHGPGYFEPTEFVARAYLYAAEVGKQPRSIQWVEVLKRLGMNHQWEQFERVVITLLAPPQYPIDEDEFYQGDDPRTTRLKAIFTSPMRKALFIWGFRSASVRDELRPPPTTRDEQASNAKDAQAQPPPVERWAQGLLLLQRLRENGFDFPVSDVQKAFVQRMWILFGPAFSGRPINHETRRNNHLSLAHYIRHANEVWPKLVDWVEPALFERDDDARLLPAFFGHVHRASLKRMEFANVQAWSEALASGAEYVIEPKKIRVKRVAWMRSPLRIPYAGPLKRPKQARLSTVSAENRPLDAFDDAETTQHSPPTPPPPAHPYPTHQLPAAHSPNSHPPPSPPNTPEQH